ncbi:MAG: hypothetical protein WC422_04560 [Candidatus Paceibacterota bacterium]|jgi:hypothetical protein
MNALIQFIKVVLITAFISGLLYAIGQAVNNLIPWSNITTFFGMIRQWSSLIDFIFPTDTLWQIVGLIFSVYPFLWSIMAIKILINNSGLRE